MSISQSEQWQALQAHADEMRDVHLRELFDADPKRGERYTLEAGDLILTGTPAGVGVYREPQRLLRPGDTVTVQIDGVGELTNPVVAG